MELNERKKMILKAIVDAYIDRGEPVGSRYLVDNCRINLSAATIRGIMNELEGLGLLEQPYTSAGRVPSGYGYRVYVDNLMQSYLLSSREIKEINESLSVKIAGLDKLVEQAAKLMSALTSLMSVSMTPRMHTGAVARFECVYIDSNNFLLVIITSPNIVKTKYIHSGIGFEPATIVLLGRLLNEFLAGKTMDMISLPVMLEIERALGGYSFLLQPVLKIVYEVMGDIEESKLYVDGMANILRQPEFRDVENVREVIGLVENKDELARIISEAQSGAVNVYIREGGTVSTKADMSFIFKNFTLGGQVIGTVGVIGPKRVDYSRIIAQLEYLAENIADAIE
jgi:heat-inducible transcriptional repressor